MYVAQMESESCSWISLGNTVNEALGALMDRWNARQRYLSQNSAINEPWLVANPKYLEEQYGVSVVKINPGECFLDYEFNNF